MAVLNINGSTHDVDVPEDKPLLWVLREDVGLRGAKYGCGIGMCGACTVLLDGKATRSCVTPVSSVKDRLVQTIEGLGDTLGKRLQDAWCKHSVSQCGYCQVGQIMAAYALLKEPEGLKEGDAKTKLTNLCRCGTYPRINRAFEDVRKQQQSEAG